MIQHATIRGEVTYREGDGMPIAIPQGPVEVNPAPDSVTVSWTADNDAAGLAALPRDQFEQYVSVGKIVLAGKQKLGSEDHGEVTEH